uniref:ASCH domain-containing protein n=1 Tax=Ignisphaera aggregans TaxID=334771 RepID=A0A7J3MX78_9CREN
MIKGYFAQLILDGLKTTTIRLGKVVPRLRTVIIHSDGKPIAEALIKNVTYKKVRELTDEDAKRDGYNSIEELLNDLRDIYGRDIHQEDVVSIIEFEITKKFSDINPEDIYLGFSPHTIAILANRYLRDVLDEEEKRIVEHILRYRSIRTTSLKLFGSLEKRWIIRKTLRKLLAKLLDRKVINVDDKTIEKLAEISTFWRRYLVEKKNRYSSEQNSDFGGGNGSK